jgi:hypothetical protein
MLKRDGLTNLGEVGVGVAMQATGHSTLTGRKIGRWLDTTHLQSLGRWPRVA